MNNHLTWRLVDDVAAKLGINPATRAKWRQEGRGVPSKRRIEIVQALMAEGVPVSLADFDSLPENPGRIAA